MCKVTYTQVTYIHKVTFVYTVTYLNKVTAFSILGRCAISQMTAPKIDRMALFGSNSRKLVCLGTLCPGLAGSNLTFASFVCILYTSTIH